IAVRNKDRKGGYTRIYLIGKRPGDAAEKAIVELVEKK
ncbi:MAG TPA: L17 family ribosomal protein, partial [Spirochaetota bacterium]|nr:L17 family ribosomal protein [Spirochaetota bacterium]